MGAVTAGEETGWMDWAGALSVDWQAPHKSTMPRRENFMREHYPALNNPDGLRKILNATPLVGRCGAQRRGSHLQGPRLHPLSPARFLGAEWRNERSSITPIRDPGSRAERDAGSVAKGTC